jgi:predicted TIM-barrel fold metal-dependent hydrolase
LDGVSLSEEDQNSRVLKMNELTEKIGRQEIGNGLIDVHTHCGFNLFNFYEIQYPYVQDAIVLSQLIIDNAISFAVTFPMPNSIYFDVPLFLEKGIFKASNLSNFPFEKENLYLLTQIKVFNLHNLLPFCSFSIRDKVREQAEYLIKLLNNFNIYGLKFHTLGDNNSILEMNKYPILMDIIEEYNLPLIVHTGNDKFSNPLNMLEIAQKYPHIRFCAAHLGKFNLKFFNEVEKYEYKNLFIDTSPFIHLCRQAVNNSKISNTILDLNYNEVYDVFNFFSNKYSDKILWGTDMPWLNVSEMKNSETEGFINYKDEVRILMRNNSVAHQIANLNTVKYLFG